jgi:16S rRNA (guanine527-N7)-methyltransferase
MKMADESDATAVPSEGAAVAVVFGDQVESARRFVGHLATTGVARGLIGPREVPRLWERHVLNCAVVEELIPPGTHVVDVGSGAGLPGIAIAILRPDLRITLLEPLLRRVEWLQELVDDLGLTNTTVLRGRAEEYAGKLGADVAAARAVAPLTVLAGWCLPLLRQGGTLLAVKGRTAAEELMVSEGALRAFGAVEWSVVRVGEQFLAEATTVVRVELGQLPPPVGRGRGRPGRPRRRG